MEGDGVSKLIRFDEDHFGYLVEHDIAPEDARAIMDLFANDWPGKRLIVMQADEFIDLTGQYEVGPIPEAVA
jgi:hypothetical protein